MSLVLDILFPRRCYVCGHTGRYFCPSCFPKLPLGQVYPPPPDSPLDGYLSVFKYHGAIRQAIHDFKFNYVTDLVPALTAILTVTLEANFQNILKYWHQHHYSLTPIPLHYLRQNWRGFNQSALISQTLAANLHLPYLPDLLTRHHHTSSQVALANRSLRLSNLAHVFSLSSDPSRNLILFDDVATTRSTLLSAASTIKKTFPSVSLWGLTIAG